MTAEIALQALTKQSGYLHRRRYQGCLCVHAHISLAWRQVKKGVQGLHCDHGGLLW